jgi:histidinol phosphatase-like enzyme
VPIYMRASCQNDENRKPETGMWKDKWHRNAFYVGDKETDDIFSKRLGIKFYYIDNFIRKK